MQEIIVVASKPCGGKSTFCQNLVFHKHIIVSDIVKKISGELQRSKLHGTGHLDTLIIEELLDQINKEEKVVVDGIRQLSILQAICLNYNNIDLVWLEVSDEELKRRYLSRDNKKDDISFEQALEGDRKLGLEEVENFIKAHKYSTIINHY